MNDDEAALRAIQLAKDFSTQLHLAAQEDGVSPRSLYEAGLRDFLRIDIAGVTDPRLIGHKAINSLLLESNGLGPAWRTILCGIIAFMLECGFDKPSSQAFVRIRDLTSDRDPSEQELESWFDGAFPLRQAKRVSN